MQSFKEKQYLVFKFEDGKDVRYNLATGETIGKNKKPVKDICTQLRNYNILSVIESFEDKNYSNFLKFIDRNFINKSENYNNRYHNKRVNKIRNLGSFLSRIDKYSHFEQFFACGIKDIDKSIKCKITEVPSGLIKICKQYNILLSDKVISQYKKNPNDFTNFLSEEFNTIETRLHIIPLLLEQDYYLTRNFNTLINTYSYNKISLLRYFDNLMTYEGIDNFKSLVNELVDYVTMMSRLSPKFEKYPRNFLTTHRIACRNYNRLKEQFIESDFQKRIDKNLEYSFENYKIIYPKTTQDIKTEACCQQNCLASYIKKVIDGSCHILFLREKDDIDKSLVTLEVRNNQCVQHKRKFNADPTREEMIVIEKYNKYLKKKKEDV